MSLSGELQTMGLADLMEWISTRRKTGTLELSRFSTKKSLAFREGALFASTSNDPRESIGQRLIKEGLITEEELFEGLSRQEREGGLLGELLVRDAALDANRLRGVLRENAEEIVYELFLWPRGHFEFRPDDLPKDVRVSLDLDTGEVILIGLRRLEKWTSLRQRFISAAVTFRCVGSGTVNDPERRRVLDLAMQGKSLAAISLESRRSEFETALVLSDLCDRGLLAVDQVGEEAVATDVVGAIEALLQTGEQRIREGATEAAFEAFEKALAMDRLNQRAKKGLVEAAAARKRARLLKKVSLDKVPVLVMGSVALTREKFDSHEGFLLSRINGQWSVRSILKLCPMPEEDALIIFARLIERKVIELT
jgi:hypothetical protein